MIKQKRTIWIKANNENEWDEMLNETLKGLIDAEIHIYGRFEGAITHTEIIYEEEEKTIADLFEEAGCGAKCEECPNFKKSEDGRVKWTVCGRNRKVTKTTRACDEFYLERRKGVPETGREDEGMGLEGRRPCRMSQGIDSGRIQQTTRKDEVYCTRERGAFGLHENRRKRAV